MPLARYFLYVGGVLLALLLISDAYLPKLPVTHAINPDVPIVRIHIRSEQKWPERIVYDTSLPTNVSAPTAQADTGGAATATANSARARVREAYAQLQSSAPAKVERKPERKRKLARHRGSPWVMVAQRQPWGWFGRSFW